MLAKFFALSLVRVRGADTEDLRDRRDTLEHHIQRAAAQCDHAAANGFTLDLGPRSAIEDKFFQLIGHHHNFVDGNSAFEAGIRAIATALAFSRRKALDVFFTQSGIEELLRFDSPVQVTSRVAMEDMEIGGRAIRAGDFLVLSLAAANRDPAQFNNPDELDISR